MGTLLLLVSGCPLQSEQEISGLFPLSYNAMKFSLQEGDIDVSLSALHHLMCAVFAGLHSHNISIFFSLV